MRREKIIFEKALRRATLFWKLTGMQITYDQNEPDQHFLEILRNRWFYIVNFCCLTFGVICVFPMMYMASTIQTALYMSPCMTLTLLGDIKSFYFIYHENKVRDIITTLKTLQSIDNSEGKEEVDNAFVKKRLPFLIATNKLLLFMCSMGVATFSLGPLMITSWVYWSTNKIKLFLPYILWYPFDEFSYRGYPVAYLHQLWLGNKLSVCQISSQSVLWFLRERAINIHTNFSVYNVAVVAVFFVYGPDCFFYTACAFIHNQFCSLQFDVRKIDPKSFGNKHSFKIQVRVILHRHRELIRCVNLLNVIYGKSTLYNVVSSSIIICLAGFNATAIDDLIMMAPFTAVLILGFVQIFLFCYYGDLLMQASMEVSDAIFNSKWYEFDLSSMKSSLFILMRAQKPCKITAFGYSDINLKTFGRILSSAWSYFTLLRTMYSK